MKNFEIGGAQKHAIQTANYLDEQGCQVKIISRSLDGLLIHLVEPDIEIKILNIPTTNNPLRLWRTGIRLLKEIPRGSIIFPNIPNEFRQISRINWALRYWKIVYIMHMDLNIRPSLLRWLKVLEVRCLLNQRNTSVVALTKKQSKKHIDIYKAFKIKVVPNFANLQHGHIKKDAGPVIRGVSVGRFVHQKGYDLLVQAMNSIDKNVTIDVFGGKDEERSKLNEKARELGLSSIEFRESLFSVEKKLAEYDFFVLPSRKEPFGLSLVEALSCGLPAVATDCDGPREIIKEGVNGIIVKKNESESLAIGINKLVAELLKGGYEKFSVKNSISHLSIDRIIPRYLEDFVEV